MSEASSKVPGISISASVSSARVFPGAEMFCVNGVRERAHMYIYIYVYVYNIYIYIYIYICVCVCVCQEFSKSTVCRLLVVVQIMRLIDNLMLFCPGPLPHWKMLTC